MAFDIFFSEDIRNALLAANKASASMALVAAEAGGDTRVMRAYLEGYRAALTTVALACGLGPQSLELPTKEREAALSSAPPPRGEP